ncbi:MAG: hypothetical protein ACK5HP_02175 [Bacilli bacterium]
MAIECYVDELECLEVMIEAMINKRKLPIKYINIILKFSKLDFFKSLDNEEGIEAEYIKYFGSNSMAIKM